MSHEEYSSSFRANSRMTCHANDSTCSRVACVSALRMEKVPCRTRDLAPTIPSTSCFTVVDESLDESGSSQSKLITLSCLAGDWSLWFYFEIDWEKVHSSRVDLFFESLQALDNGFKVRWFAFKHAVVNHLFVVYLERIPKRFFWN